MKSFRVCLRGLAHHKRFGTFFFFFFRRKKALFDRATRVQSEACGPTLDQTSPAT